MKRETPALCFAVILASGCGGGTGNTGGTGGGGAGGGSAGGCTTVFTPQCSCSGVTGSGTGTDGMCFEYAGSAYCLADGGSQGSACTAMGPSCDTANRVGTCWPPTFDMVQTNTRYYSPRFTTTSAQADCDAKSSCFIAN